MRRRGSSGHSWLWLNLAGCVESVLGSQRVRVVGILSILGRDHPGGLGTNDGFWSSFSCS